MADSFVTITGNFKEVVDFLEQVPRETMIEVNREIPSIKKESKDRVKEKLTPGNGVNVGVYKKSLVIRNLASNDQEIHFQVGGNKKHYRLTHLLEHGHRMIPNRHFYRRVSRTKAIPHIAPAQEWADKAVEELYVKAINKATKKG